MTDLSERFKNLSPEQQKLLKLRLEKKGLGATGTTAADGTRSAAKTKSAKKRQMDFSIFFFSDDGVGVGSEKYKLVVEAAKFADKNGFSAVWTPERHFQTFGGLYPNPSVLSAALAMITEHVQIRAGSVVLPLHHPIRIVEEWGLVDNLSNGRVGISFATGWHKRDYVIKPENYYERRELMFKHIKTVCKLWRGDPVSFDGVDGEQTTATTLPRPVQPELPHWVTASSPWTWKDAGETGANILSIMGPSIDDLANNIKTYRRARAQNGFDPRTGIVSLMMHTYLDKDMERAREITRQPLSDYLKNYLSQLKGSAYGESVESTESLLAFAFERYFNHSSLLGTPEKCADMVAALCDIGVNDIPCLIDFGVGFDAVMESLDLLVDLSKKFKKDTA